MAAMQTQLDSLRQQRDRVLLDMQSIDHMRRGSLSKQFFKAPPGKPQQLGPYFVLQGFFQGKKFSERVPAQEAPAVQELVENYRRFQSLAEEYITLSDQITCLGVKEPGSKKNSSPKSSPTSSSRKPKPS